MVDISIRLDAIKALLEGPSSNGQLTLDAVMGISNGGLIAADLIGRRLFRGVPIVSLWANRFDQPKGGEDSWYFKNPFNDSLVETIKNQVGDRPPVILLLDDHLGTATTATQAIFYLNEKCNNSVYILFIPMFSNRPEYIDIVEDFLPYSEQFKNCFTISKQEFIESLQTNFDLFPYLKEISSAP